MIITTPNHCFIRYQAVYDSLVRYWITITDGTLIEMGVEGAVYCDTLAVAFRVTITAGPAIGERSDVVAAIYINSAVCTAGENVGRINFEPITTAILGHITELSGKTRLRMSYC